MYRIVPALFLLACDGGAPAPGTPVDALRIAGDWVDDFGGEHTIDETLWDMGEFGLFHVVDHEDADAGWLIAENDSENLFNPGLWSRMDWVVDGSSVWFCQTAFDAPTEQAARDTPAADGTDPATDGCGGFPWSRLTPR